MKRPCITCGALIDSGSYCSQHGKTTARGYGSKWQSLSKQIIERDGGVCQLQFSGCTFRATTTDHVISKSMGGTDDPSNLVAACRACNSSKGWRPGQQQ